MNSDLENLQSKYHTVLGQLTEKTDKLQQMEQDCVSYHVWNIWAKWRFNQIKSTENNKVTIILNPNVDL